MYQRIIVINTMWVALLGAAWKFDILDPFLNARPAELPMLYLLGVIFLLGQVAITLGKLDTAEIIAQFMPKVALVLFGTSIVVLGMHADLSSSSGKSDFARAVIEAIGLNVAGVLGMVCLESLVWGLGGLRKDGEI